VLVAAKWIHNFTQPELMWKVMALATTFTRRKNEASNSNHQASGKLQAPSFKGAALVACGFPGAWGFLVIDFVQLQDDLPGPEGDMLFTFAVVEEPHMVLGLRAVWHSGERPDDGRRHGNSAAAGISPR